MWSYEVYEVLCGPMWSYVVISMTRFYDRKFKYSHFSDIDAFLIIHI